MSLHGAQNVQDVINAIESASNGKVVVSIDTNSPVALDVTEVVRRRVPAAPNLTIISANGSHAAEDLGIAGADVDGEGTLYGLSLSGDSLQNHFFIQNATVSATIDGTASMVEGSVTLGCRRPEPGRRLRVSPLAGFACHRGSNDSGYLQTC